jgi:hypothetical protein
MEATTTVGSRLAFWAVGHNRVPGACPQSIATATCRIVNAQGSPDVAY